MRGLLLWLCALPAALVACSGPDSVSGASCDPPRGPLVDWFVDATERAQVAFTYTSDSFKGGGLAVVDLDGDRLPEVIGGRRTGGLAVFHNLGDGVFAPMANGDVPEKTAVGAIATGDFDNDGDADVVIAGADATLVLENVSGQLSIAAELSGTGSTEHVLPVDLDNDGLLDLYLSNYDVADATRSTNRVLRNDGQLRFAVTAHAGTGLSWSATALDLEPDGDMDLYIANDTLVADSGKSLPITPTSWPVDQLLRNDGMNASGDFQLTDVAEALRLTMPRSSMGGLLADFNGDDQFDLYVPDYGANKLLMREADGSFIDHAAELGVSAPTRRNATCGPDAVSSTCLLLSWSAAFADFDTDGYDELMVVNGATFPTDQPPVLVFARATAPTFAERSTNLPCLDARSVIATDLDGDGDADLVIAPVEGTLRIFENSGVPPAGTWLRITLRGRTSNGTGIGARVRVRLSSGRTLSRFVGAGGVVHAAPPAEAAFGLGRETVAGIEVQWPSGRTSEHLGMYGDVELVEP